MTMPKLPIAVCRGVGCTRLQYKTSEGWVRRICPECIAAHARIVAHREQVKQWEAKCLRRRFGDVLGQN